MDIQISTQDGTPIYQQIINQVRHLVASGRLAPGEELPPIRGLAEQLTVNPNTVARAYRELELAGVVTKRRTTGTYISGGMAPLDLHERLGLLSDRVDALLMEASQLEIAPEELADFLLRRARALEQLSQEEVVR